MKIALLGDIHFGVNNSNPTITKFQLDYINNEVIPYLKENNIKHVIQLGDLFDNRVNLNINLQYEVSKGFFDVLKENDIQLYMILGNHDIFKKDSREVHSLYMFNKVYDNFTLYENLDYLVLDNKKLLMVPWLLPDEKLDLSKYKDADYIMGHFEVNNVEMMKGVTCNSSHALEMDDFNKIPTFSGHFHIHNFYESKNIFYVGNLGLQINWGDFGEPKGFHVLDLQSGDIEIVEAVSTSKHIKIYSDDENKTLSVLGLSQETLEIKVNSKTDYSIFKNHKAKIYINKDNVYNKKLIEKLDEYLFNYRVEVLEVEKVLEEKVEENRDFDAVNYIRKDLNTEFKRNVFEEIYKESIINVQE